MKLTIALLVLMGASIYALGMAFDALAETAKTRIPVPVHQVGQ